MENQDLGSKKMNNKQVNSDGNVSHQKNQPELPMKSEIEVDKNGVKRIVERARNTAPHEESIHRIVDKRLSSKPSTAPEEVGKKMTEYRDANSDITPHRLPNSHPENHK
jgi:hypothetical protein